ncbi:MAG TPA: carboxypeptidase regulatory-like domain-containing protein [Candidatus Acidoferrum sp.]|jgi:iron complex outermembrane receptor protein|nr:carboxypeptidase regulatory-like domain-containing protein [Candidatus Acidoferrum sp.]
MLPSRFAPLSTLLLAVLVGHVTDKTTGQPLPGVEVMLTGPHSAHTYTKADGGYMLAQVKPGRYLVTLSSGDVPTQLFHVTVGSGKQQTLDLVACSISLDYSCGTP